MTTTIEDRRAALEAQHRAAAQGRPWYEGTGLYEKPDPVLDHQWSGACYGAFAKRWFLGDEPGAGKTRTSIAWLDLVGAKKIVLVVEAAVAEQFAGEAMTLAPHRTIINLAGQSKEDRHENLNRLVRSRQGIAVVNYEMFRRDREALHKLMMWQADTIIVDEAHNLKNTRSSNFGYVRQIVFAENACPNCQGLVFGLQDRCGSCGWSLPGGDVKAWHRDAVKSMPVFLSSRSMKNVMLMTGTPILNTPVDLFALYHLIDPVAFPSEAGFKTRYTKPVYSGGSRSEFTRSGLEKLTELLKGRYLARKLEDVGIFLPKQRVHVMRVELDKGKYPGQARVIEQVSKHAAIQLLSGEKATIMHAISVILRKRQANVWPGGIQLTDNDGNIVLDVGDEVQESAKMDAALEKIKELHAQGRRQVVFSQFKTALAEFERRVNAAGIRAVRLDGDTPESLRTRIKTNFYAAKDETPEWDVVLVHYRTGGAGLNLTAATATHVLDEEWNAGRRDQAYARTKRMGQTQETDVYIYRMPGTVDTWMAELIALKERLVNSLGTAMSADRQVSLIVEAIRKGEM